MKIKGKGGKLYAEVTLREVVQNYNVDDLPMLAEYKRIYDENTKLRELCADMWEWLLVPTVGGATLHDLLGRIRLVMVREIWS